MSPIFVRPVREQLEHDRLIRHLQAKLKRKYEVGVNLGDEQVAPLKIGTNTFFPDLVLTEGSKLAGVIEIESGESVNNLEAMAQWVHFARARAPFSLYVPVHVFDTARRLCEALSIRPTEIWTYRASIDSFDLVRMVHDAGAVRASGAGSRARKAAAKKKAPVRKAAAKKAAPKKAAAKKASKKKAVKPAKKAAPRAKKAPARAKKAAPRTGARKK